MQVRYFRFPPHCVAMDCRRQAGKQTVSVLSLEPRLCFLHLACTVRHIRRKRVLHSCILFQHYQKVSDGSTGGALLTGLPLGVHVYATLAGTESRSSLRTDSASTAAGIAPNMPLLNIRPSISTVHLYSLIKRSADSCIHADWPYHSGVPPWVEGKLSSSQRKIQSQASR
jgi:hypothetical protein